jgi:hypothetical protein
VGSPRGAPGGRRELGGPEGGVEEGIASCGFYYAASIGTNTSRAALRSRVR